MPLDRESTSPFLVGFDRTKLRAQSDPEGVFNVQCYHENVLACLAVFAKLLKKTPPTGSPVDPQPQRDLFYTSRGCEL